MKKDPHSVYLLMDQKEFVYVGLTKNLPERIRKHKDKTFDSVVELKVRDKLEGLDFERKLTLMIRPKYSWLPPWFLKQIAQNQ